MSLIEVDPQLLQLTGARLRDAVTVATEVAAENQALAVLADDAGDGGLTDAVHTFLAKWAHGLGCLVEDAETLATMLTDSGAVYLDVETAIASAASPGGAP
jgi:hypothetical protein